MESAKLDEIGIGHVGECSRRGEGGVTSECRLELNSALACSARKRER